MDLGGAAAGEKVNAMRLRRTIRAFSIDQR
jgi:hypothetical protein